MSRKQQSRQKSKPLHEICCRKVIITLMTEQKNSHATPYITGNNIALSALSPVPKDSVIMTIVNAKFWTPHSSAIVRASLEDRFIILAAKYPKRAPSGFQK
jgi:hypothetical protein